MKKLLAVVLTLIMVLSVCPFNIAAASDLVIDMSTVQGKAGFNENSPVGLWPAAGFNDKHVIAFCNYGAYASLGTIDLSQYDAVVVTYARGQDADYGPYDTQFAITTKGAIQNGANLVSDQDAGVVAKYVFKGSVPGGWGGHAEETMSVNSNYNGEVFIASYLDPDFAHGFVVTGIRFVAKGGANPVTLDIGLLSLIVMTTSGFAILKKRRLG